MAMAKAIAGYAWVGAKYFLQVVSLAALLIYVAMFLFMLS